MQLYVTNHARNSSRIILKESIQRQGRVVFTCSSQLSLQLYFLRYSPRQDGSPVLEEMRVYPVGNWVMHYTDVSRAVAKAVVWSKLLNLKIEHPVTCSATMAYIYTACTACVTICSTGGKLRPVWSYTLLL